ncbi:MAG: diacylglycerol/polyprenol kinase family protein [Spirochaetaceae bacterium]
MQIQEMYIRTKVERNQDVYSELLRKSIHMAIALVPSAAFLNLTLTMGALAVGILFYTWTETMRLSGYSVPMVTSITRLAGRGKDAEGIVMGPVTLAIGAMLALMLYPDPVSTIAIYALAFGDGFASLVGRIWGKLPLSFNSDKTVEGSFACFAAVFLVTFVYFDNPLAAVPVAVTAMLIESLSLGDMDNVVMPFGVGLVAGILII